MAITWFCASECLCFFKLKDVEFSKKRTFFIQTLSSTLVCFCLSDWSHGCRPFTGFIRPSVFMFQFHYFLFYSYSYVRQTKLAGSLVNFWGHDKIVIDWLSCLLESLLVTESQICVLAACSVRWNGVRPRQDRRSKLRSAISDNRKHLQLDVHARLVPAFEWRRQADARSAVERRLKCELHSAGQRKLRLDSEFESGSKRQRPADGFAVRGVFRRLRVRARIFRGVPAVRLWHRFVCVNLHPRHKRTDGRTDARNRIWRT